MRQLTLVFLLCVSLFSSGYRFRCFLFCHEQTGVQNDYLENSNDCNDYADTKLSDAIENEPNPDSEKAQNVKFRELFRDCMAKKGWDVPSGNRKLASKDDSFPAINTPSAVAKQQVDANNNNNAVLATINKNDELTNEQVKSQPEVTKKANNEVNSMNDSVYTKSTEPQQQLPVVRKQFQQEQITNRDEASKQQQQLNSQEKSIQQPQQQLSADSTSVQSKVPATIVEQPNNINSQPQPTIKKNSSPIISQKTPPKNVLRVSEEKQKIQYKNQASDIPLTNKSTQVSAPVQAVEAKSLDTPQAANTVNSLPQENIVSSQQELPQKAVNAQFQPQPSKVVAPAQKQIVQAQDVQPIISKSPPPITSSQNVNSQPQTSAQKLSTNSTKQAEVAKAKECSLARISMKLSNKAAAKAEECDLECADALKFGSKIYPAACPPDVISKKK